MTKVLIAAAGTGGHVWPALTVAEALRARGADVVWLGTTHGIENRLVPPTGISLRRVVMRGLRGKGRLNSLLALFKLVYAVLKVGAIFAAVRPDVVLVMGGYISGPAALWAKLWRCRLLAHEQNAICGTANRLLSRWAYLCFSAYPDVFPAGCPTRCVGNPVRPALLAIGEHRKAQMALTQAPANKPCRVLILGGTLGASPINHLVKSLCQLPQIDSQSFEIWHQTGSRDEEDLQNFYQRSVAVQACAQAFIDDMEAAWRWADVVIARAGAMTVSEIVAVACPALLIPLPQAIDDHQTHNAKHLADQGGALLCPQSTTTPVVLWQVLHKLVSDSKRRWAMQQQLLKLAPTNACDEIVAACLQKKV